MLQTRYQQTSPVDSPRNPADCYLADPNGTSFTMDDLSLSSDAMAVPEPSSVFTVLLGAFYLLVRRLRRPVQYCLLALGLLSTHSYAAQKLHSLSATPSILYVNEPASVRITVQIAPDPTLISSSVTLQEVDSRKGRVIGTIGRMYDDGTHGDLKAGDNIFTLTYSITTSRPTTRYFRANAAYQGRLLRVPSVGDLDIPIVAPVSDADINIRTSIQSAAMQRFDDEITQHGDPLRAFNATVAWISAQPGVSRVTPFQRTWRISIEFSSGLSGNVTLGPSDDLHGTPQ